MCQYNNNSPIINMIKLKSYRLGVLQYTIFFNVSLKESYLSTKKNITVLGPYSWIFSRPFMHTDEHMYLRMQQMAVKRKINTRVGLSLIIIYNTITTNKKITPKLNS